MGRKVPLKKDLIREVKNNFAEINIRFIESDGQEESFFSGYNEKFKALTKTKNKKRVSAGNLSRMNKQQLQDILSTQKQFLSSPLSTEKGRKDVYKARKKSLEKNLNMKLTDSQYNKMINLLNSDTVKQAIENNKLDSEQIVSLVKEHSRKNIIRVIEKATSSDNYNSMSPQEFIGTIYDTLQGNKGT